MAAKSTAASISNYIEFLAPFLSCGDLCKLAQTSKDVKTAVEMIEESVFGACKLVQVMNKAVIVACAARCTHIRSDGKRFPMTVPMPFGSSSKAKLRAVEQQRKCWKLHDACVRVDIREEFQFPNELLFVTKSYTDNVIERFSHNAL
jgi:hypothetical protein